ncbi:DUF4232 domain-containing protein [Streptomyces sp. MI02-2A]|jgi:hypothetical protein|uniref:DUF4232 domain-containing protein n=1 Tax=unclassified Streptomyces TaxID=2593676 RepID=UPI000740F15B|nr:MULTISPECIES: DUF4232 domain-containing protein [unclassified Streptomyces]KUJ35255.1 hypothetical protein ADL25_37875 [Streptomyces sp. NRRL F-5122]MDX3265668.1 DUF4232 domain-containing protein [Streptomyces sp. MI02-2A]REE62576.1 uncharacterized protein DUF4232 [Streptomyces sp. 3212.3]
MRTFRNARPHTALLATTTAALAVLALTACQSGMGTQDEGKASSTPTVSSAAHSPAAQNTGSSQAGSGSGSSTAQGSDAASHTGKGTGTGSAGGGSASGKGSGTTTASPVLCNGANTRVTAQEVSRPVDHMLITATNTGSRPCALTYYPFLRFDEMQWAPGAFEESRPQAVTTLAPGESGYAGVRLSAADGSGENGTTGHKLTVLFQGRTPRSDAGPTAEVKLPAKGVHYDSELTATYWQATASDALTW